MLKTLNKSYLLYKKTVITQAWDNFKCKSTIQLILSSNQFSVLFTFILKSIFFSKCELTQLCVPQSNPICNAQFLLGSCKINLGKKQSLKWTSQSFTRMVTSCNVTTYTGLPINDICFRYVANNIQQRIYKQLKLSTKVDIHKKFSVKFL